MVISFCCLWVILIIWDGIYYTIYSIASEYIFYVFLFSPSLKELTVRMQEQKKSRLKKPLIKELQKNEKELWQNKQVIL